MTNVSGFFCLITFLLLFKKLFFKEKHFLVLLAFMRILAYHHILLKTFHPDP